MSDVREGGCLCGNIRYKASWPPLMVASCSCLNCQKQAGSALSVIAAIPQDGMQLSGQLSTYEDTADSGEVVCRKFCGDCGSPVITETPGAAKQNMLFIKAGTLDDVSDLQPTTHFWTCSAQPWVTFPADTNILETQ